MAIQKKSLLTDKAADTKAIVAKKATTQVSVSPSKRAPIATKATSLKVASLKVSALKVSALKVAALKVKI